MNHHEVVWILGAGGRIGRALARVLDPMEYRILLTDKKEVDVTNLEEVMEYAERNMPMAIINCAALSNAGECEKRPEEAFQVNALGARNAAIVANYIGAKLVHLSTDDVFSGEAKTPYNEFHVPDSRTVYGLTKGYGETFVRELCNQYFILRSSWVYDIRTLKKIRLGVQRGALEFAGEQVSTPTSARTLARFIATLIDTNEFGIYHYTSQGTCTRYEFIQQVASLLGLSEEFSRAKKRELKESIHPDYANLECLMLKMKGAKLPGDWKEELAHYVKEFLILENERGNHE